MDISRSERWLAVLCRRRGTALTRRSGLEIVNEIAFVIAKTSTGWGRLISDGVFYIVDVVVRSEHQSKGLGTAIMNVLEGGGLKAFSHSCRQSRCQLRCRPLLQAPRL